MKLLGLNIIFPNRLTSLSLYITHSTPKQTSTLLILVFFLPNTSILLTDHFSAFGLFCSDVWTCGYMDKRDVQTERKRKGKVSNSEHSLCWLEQLHST